MLKICSIIQRLRVNKKFEKFLATPFFQDGGWPLMKNMQKAISRERIKIQYFYFAVL